MRKDFNVMPTTLTERTTRFHRSESGEFPSNQRRLRFMTWRVSCVLICLMAFFLAPHSWAENNTTNLIDNTVTNYSSLNIPASSPGTNNSLQILNGGMVGITNGDLTIGPNFGDNNNYVLVSGTNSLGDPSRLTVTGTTFTTTYVGHTGSGNQLIVTNGGQVIGQALHGRIIIGYLAPSNSVTVTGPNSVMTFTNSASQGTVNLGWSAGFNQLTIDTGGRVNSVVANVGSIAAGAVSNVALVTGAGSVWSNSSTFAFGMGSAGNRLIISDGGRVDVGGDFNSYNGLANNSVLVTGSNSLLSLPGSDIFLSGDNVRMTIANGGRVVNRSGYIGYTANTNNVVIVTDPGSLWSNTTSITMGHPAASGTRLIVTNGGLVVSPTLTLGGSAAATSNTVVIVTGSNSTVNLTSALTIGSISASNTFQILNGGRLKSGVGNIGSGLNASNNFVLVSGAGSVWTNTAAVSVGVNAGGNRLTVTNGGRVDAVNMSIGGPSATIPDNRLEVTGNGSVVSLSSTIEAGGHNARITISDGARVSNISEGYIGNGLASATNVVAIVSGPGTQWTNGSHLSVGYVASGAQLIITNGARVDNNTGYIGRFASSTNNSAIVTGAGSLWRNNTLTVGNNGTSLGGGNALVTEGGTIEAATWLGGSSGSGTISNRGGIYQFATVSPTITPNTANSIVITNGTISYRDVSGANIYNAEVAEMTFQGNNRFQLKNATNASVTAYTFDSIANTGTPTNYQRLVLVEGGSRWVGGNLTIGSGGALLVSNSAEASVSAVVTNLGTITVVNSKMTFEGKVVISGSYVSDPSTNTYLADVTVSQSGSLAGGVGDLFDFKKSLFINSTNRFGFDLAKSAVMFSGGGMHTNAITGQDYGTNDVGFANNFAYGELHLGSAADQICFTCGNIPAVPSNGLYIGWLDLLGNANLVTNLHAANGINLYYDKTDTRNAYLGGLTYALTDCDFNPGGGSLIALIPEPSALLLLSFAAVMLLTRKR